MRSASEGGDEPPGAASRSVRAGKRKVDYTVLAGQRALRGESEERSSDDAHLQRADSRGGRRSVAGASMRLHAPQSARHSPPRGRQVAATGAGSVGALHYPAPKRARAEEQYEEEWYYDDEYVQDDDGDERGYCDSRGEGGRGDDMDDVEACNALEMLAVSADRLAQDEMGGGEPGSPRGRFIVSARHRAALMGPAQRDRDQRGLADFAGEGLRHEQRGSPASSRRRGPHTSGSAPSAVGRRPAVKGADAPGGRRRGAAPLQPGNSRRHPPYSGQAAGETVIQYDKSSGRWEQTAHNASLGYGAIPLHIKEEAEEGEEAEEAVPAGLHDLPAALLQLIAKLVGAQEALRAREGESLRGTPAQYMDALQAATHTAVQHLLRSVLPRDTSRMGTLLHSMPPDLRHYFIHALLPLLATPPPEALALPVPRRMASAAAPRRVRHCSPPPVPEMERPLEPAVLQPLPPAPAPAVNGTPELTAGVHQPPHEVMQQLLTRAGMLPPAPAAAPPAEREQHSAGPGPEGSQLSSMAALAASLPSQAQQALQAAVLQATAKGGSGAVQRAIMALAVQYQQVAVADSQPPVVRAQAQAALEQLVAAVLMARLQASGGPQQLQAAAAALQSAIAAVGTTQPAAGAGSAAVLQTAIAAAAGGATQAPAAGAAAASAALQSAIAAASGTATQAPAAGAGAASAALQAAIAAATAATAQPLAAGTGAAALQSAIAAAASGTAQLPAAGTGVAAIAERPLVAPSADVVALAPLPTRPMPPHVAGGDAAALSAVSGALQGAGLNAERAGQRSGLGGVAEAAAAVEGGVRSAELAAGMAPNSRGGGAEEGRNQDVHVLQQLPTTEGGGGAEEVCNQVAHVLQPPPTTERSGSNGLRGADECSGAAAVLDNDSRAAAVDTEFVTEAGSGAAAEVEAVVGAEGRGVDDTLPAVLAECCEPGSAADALTAAAVGKAERSAACQDDSAHVVPVQAVSNEAVAAITAAGLPESMAMALQHNPQLLSQVLPLLQQLRRGTVSTTAASALLEHAQQLADAREGH